MQIGEVAARTELSLRTIRHHEETGLVVPSARSRGGFRLMVIRRTDRLDSGEDLGADEREACPDRVRGHERAAAILAAAPRTQPGRAEESAAALRARLTGPRPRRDCPEVLPVTGSTWPR